MKLPEHAATIVVNKNSASVNIGMIEKWPEGETKLYTEGQVLETALKAVRDFSEKTHGALPQPYVFRNNGLRSSINGGFAPENLYTETQVLECQDYAYKIGQKGVHADFNAFSGKLPEEKKELSDMELRNIFTYLMRAIEALNGPGGSNETSRYIHRQLHEAKRYLSK